VINFAHGFACFAFRAFRRAAHRARYGALILARDSALRPFRAELFRFTADRDFPPTEPLLLEEAFVTHSDGGKPYCASVMTAASKSIIMRQSEP
jgi:hypothetical protein